MTDPRTPEFREPTLDDLYKTWEGGAEDLADDGKLRPETRARLARVTFAFVAGLLGAVLAGVAPTVRDVLMSGQPVDWPTLWAAVEASAVTAGVTYLRRH